MKLQILAGGLSLALAGFAFSTSAQAFTAITTQWDETHLSQDECLDRAAAAVEEGGFRPLAHTLQSRHGIRGDYTVAVRCLTEMHVVFFVVAGPSRDVTPKYEDEVHKHFRF
jgi:hypothetical protein